jgi:chromosome segregation ATPase
MSTVHAIYILSGAGALLFVLAGYLARSAGALRSSRELQRRLLEAEARATASADDVEKPQPPSQAGPAFELAETLAALEVERVRRVAAEEVLAPLQADLDRLRDELRRHGETLHLAAESIEAADGRTRLAETRAEELTRQLQAASAARAAAESLVRERTNTAEVRRLESERARASLIAAEAQLHERNSLVENRRIEFEALRASLAAAEMRLAERERELAIRRAESGAGLAAVNAVEAQVRDRDGVIADQRQEIAGVHARLATAEAQIADRDNVIAIQRGEITQLRALAEGRATESAADVDSARRQLAAAQAELNATGLRASALDAELASHLAELRDLRSRLQVSESKLSDLGRVQDDNARLREEQAHAEASQRELTALQNEANDLRVALRAAQARLGEVERLAEENGSLRQSLAELEEHREAAAELERVQADYKRVRLDAEMMARRLQELRPIQSEVTELRAQIAELPALLAELDSRRRHEQDLEARLYALGQTASLSISERLPPPADSIVGSMEAQLGALLDDRGPRTAVLADEQGFLVAGAGEAAPQEALAAFVAVVNDIVVRVCGLLPVAEVLSVRLEAQNHVVVSCHLFQSGESGLGLATIGTGDPELRVVQRTVKSLAAVVASGSSRVSLPALEDPQPIDGSN